MSLIAAALVASFVALDAEPFVPALVLLQDKKDAPKPTAPRPGGGETKDRNGYVKDLLNKYKYAYDGPMDKKYEKPKDKPADKKPPEKPEAKKEEPKKEPPKTDSKPAADAPKSSTPADGGAATDGKTTEAPKPNDTPVTQDGKIVSKDEKPPDFVGRVTGIAGGETLMIVSVRVPPPNTLVKGEDRSFHIDEKTKMTFHGAAAQKLEPRTSLVVYVWLRADSKVADEVRFGSEEPAAK